MSHWVVTRLHFGTISEPIPVCCEVQVRRSDVMSAWSGIRPLASDPDAQDTAGASRDHVVSMDTDGMITIAGLAAPLASLL